MKPTLALTFVSLLLATPALAEMPDGPWTMEQLKAVYPDLTEAVFTQIDASADGTVDQAELDAAIAAGVVAPVEG